MNWNVWRDLRPKVKYVCSENILQKCINVRTHVNHSSIWTASMCGPHRRITFVQIRFVKLEIRQ